MGYQPVSTWEAFSSYIPVGLVRPLGTSSQVPSRYLELMSPNYSSLSDVPVLFVHVLFSLGWAVSQWGRRGEGSPVLHCSWCFAQSPCCKPTQNLCKAVSPHQPVCLFVLSFSVFICSCALEPCSRPADLQTHPEVPGGGPGVPPVSAAQVNNNNNSVWCHSQQHHSWWFYFIFAGIKHMKIKKRQSFQSRR